MNLALILICVLIYMKYGNTTDKRIIKKYVYFITFLLILFSGIRHEAVGNDNYAPINSNIEITSGFRNVGGLIGTIDGSNGITKSILLNNILNNVNGYENVGGIVNDYLNNWLNQYTHLYSK